jgi:hypothetical protein
MWHLVWIAPLMVRLTEGERAGLSKVREPRRPAERSPSVIEPRQMSRARMIHINPRLLRSGYRGPRQMTYGISLV